MGGDDDDFDADKMMRHIFIQWLTTKGLLDEWLERTLDWHDDSYGGDMKEIQFKGPKFMVDSFPWTGGWINVNDEWETFYEDWCDTIAERCNES